MKEFTLTTKNRRGRKESVTIIAENLDAALRVVSERTRIRELKTVHDVLGVYAKGKDLGGGGRAMCLVMKLDRNFGSLDPYEFNQVNIDEYVESQTTEGVSMATIHRDLKILRAAFNYAEARKKISGTTQSEWKFSSKEERRERVFSRSELARLFRAARTFRRHKRMSWQEIYLWVALFTGARPGAVADLLWSKIDMEKWVIDFRNDKELVKRRTLVPVAKALRPALRRAWRERDPGCRYLLQRADRLTRPGPNIIDNVVTTFAVIAGIPLGTGRDRVCNYTLRHTAASLMLASGTSVWAVAGTLAISPDRLIKSYAKHLPSSLQKAVDSI